VKGTSLFPFWKPTRDESAYPPAGCPPPEYHHGISKTEDISEGINVSLVGTATRVHQPYNINI
jgi:hypothetical protein